MSSSKHHIVRPPQTVVTRRGGLGDALPNGATRKTARQGIAPVAVPYAVIRDTKAPSLIEDMAERLELGVAPDELLCTWEIHNVHMARRHWPDYWLRVKGIDLKSIVGEVVGPIFPPLSQDPPLIPGRRLLLLRGEIRWRDSPVYGLLRYRREWSEPKITVEGIEHQRNRYDVQMAERGLELLKGHAPRGRSRADREPELNRLAKLGLQWVAVRGKGRSADDITWINLAATAVGDSKKMQGKAGKLGISIADVRQRVRDLQAWGIDP